MREQVTQTLKIALVKPTQTVLDLQALSSVVTRTGMESSKTFADLAQRLNISAPLERMLTRNRKVPDLSPIEHVGSASDYLPVSTYAPLPERYSTNDDASEINSVSSFCPTSEHFWACEIPTTPEPFPLFDTTRLLEKSLLTSSIGRSSMIPFSEQQSTTIPTNSANSDFTYKAHKPIARDTHVPSFLASSSNVLNRNLDDIRMSESTAISRRAALDSTNHIVTVASDKKSRTPPRDLEPWQGLSLPSAISDDVLPRAIRTSSPTSQYPRNPIGYNRERSTKPSHRTSAFRSAENSQILDDPFPRMQVDDWLQGSPTSSESFQNRGIAFELEASSIITRAQDNAFELPTADRGSNRSENRNPLAPRASRSTTTSDSPYQEPKPFCAIAHQMQRAEVIGNWHAFFTFSLGRSEVKCNECKSQISVQRFRIRDQSTIWEFSSRFMVKCHRSYLVGAENSFGCPFCQDVASFRSRNEFWAHLETHTSRELEGDADVLRLA